MRKNWQHDYKHSARLISIGVGTEAFFSAIEQELPPIVSRAEASRITGGLISVKTLANEDSLKVGPRERVRMGSKIGYTRSAYMAYLREKLRQC